MLDSAGQLPLCSGPSSQALVEGRDLEADSYPVNQLGAGVEGQDNGFIHPMAVQQLQQQTLHEGEEGSCGDNQQPQE